MHKRTELETNYLELVSGFEKADLIAMLEDWIDHEKLPRHCMQAVITQCTPKEEVTPPALTLEQRIVAIRAVLKEYGKKDAHLYVSHVEWANPEEVTVTLGNQYMRMAHDGSKQHKLVEALKAIGKVKPCGGCSGAYLEV